MNGHLRWRSGDRDHRVIGTLLCGGLKWSTEGGSEETDSSPICFVESERTRARGRSLFYQKKKEKGPFSQGSFCSQPRRGRGREESPPGFPLSLPPSLLPAIALKLFDIFPNDGQTVCVVCLSGCRVDCRVDTTICKKGHTRAHAPRCKLGRFKSRSQAQCGSLFLRYR